MNIARTALRHRFAPHGLPAIALALSAGTLAPLAAVAQDACGAVAELTRMACDTDVEEEHLLARANCRDVPGAQQSAECRMHAGEERVETSLECATQHAARLELCALLGPARYAPAWRREDFVADQRTLDATSANPYWPLRVGMQWIYQGDGERITVAVQAATKRIRRGTSPETAVDCLVVNDLVEEVEGTADAASFLAAPGIPIEDTDDWYAQDLGGTVWYCGEIARNYAVFAGDRPRLPELVDIDGSWKAWVDGARPGILMLATPVPGAVYRQELLLDDAEDAGTVLSVSASGFLEGDDCDNAGDLVVDPGQVLATHCGAGDCVVVRDFTPLEPEANEHKYFARGVGLVLAVDREDMSCEVLVSLETP